MASGDDLTEKIHAAMIHGAKSPTVCPETIVLHAAEEQRFAERTMVERVYSRLKDEFGARSIRLRGAGKIVAHLIFRRTRSHRRSTP